MLLLKNLQLVPNHCETLSQRGTHECLIVTKFPNDWVKYCSCLYYDVPVLQSGPKNPELHLLHLEPMKLALQMQLPAESQDSERST